MVVLFLLETMMKTYYELIEETANFDFNDVVLNSHNYQYFNDKEPPMDGYKKAYLMRRIYMQQNVLKWVHITSQHENEDRIVLAFDWRGVSIADHNRNDVYFILPDSELMGEDEFFQFTLLHNLHCIDHELYKKIYNFYHSVLIPIINF